MGNVLTFDPRALLDRYYDVHVSESNDDVLKDYVVEEDVKTFFFKANLDMDVLPSTAAHWRRRSGWSSSIPGITAAASG